MPQVGRTFGSRFAQLSAITVEIVPTSAEFGSTLVRIRPDLAKIGQMFLDQAKLRRRDHIQPKSLKVFRGPKTPLRKDKCPGVESLITPATGTAGTRGATKASALSVGRVAANIEAARLWARWVEACHTRSRITKSKDDLSEFVLFVIVHCLLQHTIRKVTTAIRIIILIIWLIILTITTITKATIPMNHET